MTDTIKRAKTKIEEILNLCGDIKDELGMLSVLDMNNTYQTEQRLSTSELNCRKLSSRCDEIFELLQNSNLSDTSGAKAKKETLFAKGSLSSKEVDDIIYIFDEFLRGLDNLEFAAGSSISSVNKSEMELYPKIFISHSSNDKEYVQALVELLEDMGIKEDQLFCSSLAEYGIPLNKDIYEYLKTQFKKYSLQVIFVLSDEYYKSAACLNEMGAAWVLQSEYSTVLLPKFEFKNIRGAINPNRVSIKLDNPDMSARLNELKDNMIQIFNLPSISQTKWERHKNEFTSKIQDVSK